MLSQPILCSSTRWLWPWLLYVTIRFTFGYHSIWTSLWRNSISEILIGPRPGHRLFGRGGAAFRPAATRGSRRLEWKLKYSGLEGDPDWAFRSFRAGYYLALLRIINIVWLILEVYRDILIELLEISTSSTNERWSATGFEQLWGSEINENPRRFILKNCAAAALLGSWSHDRLFKPMVIQWGFSCPIPKEGSA